MRYEDDESPKSSTYGTHRAHASPTASISSPSSASVWSDAASIASDDSSTTSTSSNSDTSEPYHYIVPQPIREDNKSDTSVPAHGLSQQKSNASYLRHGTAQHPRRSNVGSSRHKLPPSLVRQRDRKSAFVNSLIDAATKIVEAIWPLSSMVCPSDKGHVLPLKTFIREMLRRSKTSYSTLQLALYYLVLVKPCIPIQDFTMEQHSDDYSARALQCGRRMFLSALILATKYLQDRNYSAGAWSKISGLNIVEINQSEMAFLMAVNFELFIPGTTFQKWNEMLLKYTSPFPAESSVDWKLIIESLDPLFARKSINSMSAIDNEPSATASSPQSHATGLVAPESYKLDTPAVSATSHILNGSCIEHALHKSSKPKQPCLTQTVYVSENTSRNDSVSPSSLAGPISTCGTICSAMESDAMQLSDPKAPTQPSISLQRSIRTLLSSATYWTEDSITAHTLGIALSLQA